MAHKTHEIHSGPALGAGFPVVTSNISPDLGHRSSHKFSTGRTAEAWKRVISCDSAARHNFWVCYLTIPSRFLASNSVVDQLDLPLYLRTTSFHRLFQSKLDMGILYERICYLITTTCTATRSLPLAISPKQVRATRASLVFIFTTRTHASVHHK